MDIDQIIRICTNNTSEEDKQLIDDELMNKVKESCNFGYSFAEKNDAQIQIQTQLTDIMEMQRLLLDKIITVEKKLQCIEDKLPNLHE